MSKSRGKTRRQPAFSLEVMLRPHLDQLFTDQVWPSQPDEALAADLDRVTQNCKPDVVVTTLLNASLAAPQTTQTRLEQVIPAWLTRRGHVSVLEGLVANRPLDTEQHARATAWLTAAGGKALALQPAATDWFFRAFHVVSEWQSEAMVFWYSHPKRSRVKGLGFLIDRNPPWEGALKDVMEFPNREPSEMLREFVDGWRASEGSNLEEISAAQVKREILTALQCNRAEAIRLPRDLIAARDLFLRHVLTLPDEPDAPSFTAEDFRYLSTHGETPESISHFEHTVGRLMRLEDGGEVLVDPAFAEMDGDDLDDEDDAPDTPLLK